MTFLRNVNIGYADGPSVDAFGRLRVSNPETLFDSKLSYGKNTDVWDEDVNDVSGSAAATYDTNKVTLSVGANSSDRAIRQTKLRFNYLPGKSQFIFTTFVLGEDAGTTKRVGYFNTSTAAPYTSNRDGIYLEHDGTSVYIVQEKNGVTTNTKIAQSNWNIDVFDGNGPSGQSIDWNDAQIMIIDMEWLGVGRVRVGFVINGIIYYAHEFNNANGIIQAITEPYIDSPNHSVRAEVYSDGSAGSLVFFCCSVQSEGGVSSVGGLFSVDRGITAFATGNDTNLYPVISIRLRSDRPDGSIILNAASLICTSTAAFRWVLLLNPTVGGTDQASWVNVGGNSAVEYDVSRDNTNTLSGGTQLEGGHLEDTPQQGGAFLRQLNAAARPGIGIDGTQDEIVLAVQNLAAGAEDYYAALDWREPL